MSASSVPPAPSLGHLKKSANSICLVKDGGFGFNESVDSEGSPKCYYSQPIQLGEPSLQGPNDPDCSGVVTTVSACIQQLKADENEEHRQLCKLGLCEGVNRKRYYLLVDLNERFVGKIRGLLLAPFLTVKGFIYVLGSSAPSKKHHISHQIELHPMDCDLRCVIIAQYPRKTLNPTEDEDEDDVKLSVKGKLSVILGWREPEGTEIKLSANSMLKTLLPESSKDLTIVTGDGAELKCHRSVFEAHSPVLAAMISPENGMKEGQTGRIEMPESSKVGIRHLLRYFYCKELDTDQMNCAVGLELLKTAHKYELTYLEICVRDWLLRKGKEWYGPNVILELYFFVRNVKDFEKLRGHSLCVMRGMLSEIRFCDRFKELNHEEKENLLNIKGAD